MELVSDEVKSVWYRRPNQFNLQIRDLAQRELARDELSAFLEGLWLSMRDVFWMNDPHSLQRARKKILQLQIAREIGFRIPRTVVTNNPKEVENFLLECGGRIVFKTLKRGFLESGEKGFNIPTTLVDPSHLERLELVRKVPCLFQECLQKDYELRVTVVGKEVFSVKIDSQASPLTAIDWRRPELIGDLRYEVHDLPKEVSDRCIWLMEILGLQFGAFDFVVNKEGRYIFLEVNPGGQWYWLEHKLGACISSAISDKLALASGEGR
jgi:glutathione synthase/RimK-type ligase-like ATP-grasp enzyme